MPRRPVPQRSPGAPDTSRRGLRASAPAPQRNLERRAEAQLRGRAGWKCLGAQPARRPEGPARQRGPPSPNGSSALTQCGGRPGTGARLRSQLLCRLRSRRSRRRSLWERWALPRGRRGRAAAGLACPGRLVVKKTWKGCRVAVAGRPVSDRTNAFQPAKLPQQHSSCRCGKRADYAGVAKRDGESNVRQKWTRA